MKTRFILHIIVAMAVTAAFSSPLFAEWTVTYLHPAGCNSSYPNGVSGGQQVGCAAGPATGNQNHASLWSGTAASWVDLNPAGCNSSYASGVSGGQQVGWAWGSATGGNYHASLWSSTAASWLDLNPTGYDHSEALGISGGQQVGRAYGSATGGYQHASLWNGTAASWLDLNPTGFTESFARGISGGRQVGWAKGSATGNQNHASLWSGTAASWVNLHTFLDSRYAVSYATGIEVSGNDIWVAGYAFDDVRGYNEAVLWHNVIPEPSSFLALVCGLAGLTGTLRRRGK